jgi:hypothetical protein
LISAKKAVPVSKILFMTVLLRMLTTIHSFVAFGSEMVASCGIAGRRNRVDRLEATARRRFVRNIKFWRDDLLFGWSRPVVGPQGNIPDCDEVRRRRHPSTREMAFFGHPGRLGRTIPSRRTLDAIFTKDRNYGSIELLAIRQEGILWEVSRKALSSHIPGRSVGPIWKPVMLANAGVGKVNASIATTLL